jgi:hypothetical protein
MSIEIDAVHSLSGRGQQKFELVAPQRMGGDLGN